MPDTELPDRLKIGQNLVENAKIKNSNETFWMILKHCAYIDTNFKFNFEYLKTVRNGKPDFIPWL